MIVPMLKKRKCMQCKEMNWETYFENKKFKQKCYIKHFFFIYTHLFI